MRTITCPECRGSGHEGMNGSTRGRGNCGGTGRVNVPDARGGQPMD